MVGVDKVLLSGFVVSLAAAVSYLSMASILLDTLSKVEVGLKAYGDTVDKILRNPEESANFTEIYKQLYEKYYEEYNNSSHPYEVEVISVNDTTIVAKVNGKTLVFRALSSS